MVQSMQTPRDDNRDTDYNEIFDNANVALWVEDFSHVVGLLNGLRAKGVEDPRSYFQEHPEHLREAIALVRILDANACAVTMFGAATKAELLNSLTEIFLPETDQVFIEELVCIWEGQSHYKGETVLKTLKGRTLDVTFTIAFNGEHFNKTIVSFLDNSNRRKAEAALVKQSQRLETFNRIARTIAEDLNHQSVVQRVVDAGTEFSGAQFGAFFYNRVDHLGERYLLYALSGAPRSAFEKFSIPRNTPLFDPTFQGRGIIRSDDIRADPRYGKVAPHYGMPAGHLPVVSYLAVPVVSRSGAVIGGLFFGHAEPGVFTDEVEHVIEGVAAYAAVAVENARLFESAQKEIETRRRAEKHAQHFIALVESSDDAIVSKSLEGIVMSWNSGAERLFGYSAEEIIGKSITILIPHDRQDEEPEILARIRSGERIEHYETVRQRKDGNLVDISLTVSPIKDQSGQIVGASKIARDITERKIAEEQQQRMFQEMNHRIRNLFSLASSMVAFTARTASTTEELSKSLRERLDALARAHALTLSGNDGCEPDHASQATLHTIIQAILRPYHPRDYAESARVQVRGADMPASGRFVTDLALLFYECATNAAKYGALSVPDGSVDIESVETADGMLVRWKEIGGPTIARPSKKGFGSRLTQATVASLGAKVSYEWDPEGLTIHLSLPRFV